MIPRPTGRSLEVTTQTKDGRECTTTVQLFDFGDAGISSQPTPTESQPQGKSIEPSK